MPSKSWIKLNSAGRLFRAAYIFSLLLIASASVVFFYKQHSQESHIRKFDRLASELRDVSLAVYHYAHKARIVSETISERFQPEYVMRDMQNMSIAERKLYHQALELDVDNISYVTGLRYYHKILEEKYDSFIRTWESEKALFAPVFQAQNPFLGYGSALLQLEYMVTGKQIDRIRTKADLYWITLSIKGISHSRLLPALTFDETRLQSHLEKLNNAARSRLGMYSSVALFVIVLIGLGIFLPVDMFIQHSIRTVKLHAQKSEAARKTAVSAKQSQSRFLASFSHEIKTPLYGVLGMIELLEKSNLDERQKTLVNVISNSGKRLGNVISNILDVTEIEAGNLQMQSASFSLPRLVKKAVREQEDLAVEKDLKLNVHVSPDLPENFVGDKMRIGQVLGNLIDNAVKFTESGSVTITVEPCGIISRKAIGSGKCSVLVQVIDTGIGICNHQREQIERRMENDKASFGLENHDGSCLGVPIAASLVRLMGGKIGFESTPDRGSNFWVKLDLELAENRASPRSYGDSMAVQLARLRVLVGVHQEEEQSVLVSQLGDKVREAAACSSAREVLTYLEATSSGNLCPDVLIYDCSLPDMQVEDAIGRIRSNSKLADLSIILTNSQVFTARGSSIASLNIDGILKTPTISEMLLNYIQAVVERRVNLAARKNSSAFGGHEKRGLNSRYNPKLYSVHGSPNMVEIELADSDNDDGIHDELIKSKAG